MALKVEDAAAKVALVETEIAFNQAVTSTLEEVERLCQQLGTGRAALNDGKIMAAIDILEETATTVKTDNLFTNTNVMNVLSDNVAGLRQEIADFLLTRWNEQLSIDKQQRKLLVSQYEGNAMLEEMIAALNRLDMLVPATDKLQKDLLSTIIDPALLPGAHLQSLEVQVKDSGIEVEEQPKTAAVSEVLEHISQVLNHLQESLPTTILNPFSDYFIPTLASRIISSWLSSAIPTELERLSEFESTLDHVLKFAHSIETFGWHGHEELVSWVNQAPRLWLTRRRVDSLDQVRKVLAASRGTTKQVERVEKEQVSQADETLLENAPADDWDAGWDDENEEDTNGKPAEHPEDDPGVSAWGLDEDTKDDIQDTKPDVTESAEDDDAGDAWGWGDEEDEEPQKQASQASKAPAAKSINGNGTSEHASPKEVTLRETYVVTDIPDSILDIVRRQITDSETVARPV